MNIEAPTLHIRDRYLQNLFEIWTIKWKSTELII